MSGACGQNRLGVSARFGHPGTLPFPLTGGEMATLSVPVPLSQRNYTYLNQMVGTTLAGMKEAIVTDGTTTDDDK